MVVWDLVNESGLYRLKGHKGPITHCHFLQDKNMLISRYFIDFESVGTLI